MKTRIITIITLSLTLLLAACNNENTKEPIKENTVEIKAQTEKPTINNQHEWDPLKEVVVGRWVKNTMVNPTIDMGMKEIFPYIPDDAWGYLKKAENQMLSDVYPEDDQLYYDEQENLVKTLESLGVKVRRPDEIEFPVTATTQCYSRDPIITIGNKMIITNLNFEGRRQETGNYRRIALDLAKNYNGEIVSMPANIAGYSEENIYLEGGDVFVNGKEVYVGMTGNATNDKGIEWLRNELGSEYTVYKIPLHKNVLHLDCAMMLLNEKQGIICKEDFIDFEALPESLKNREWVEAKPKEAQLMATNGVAVGPKTMIMSDAFPHIAKQVRAMGIKVIELPFKKANYFGGGLRCSYQPIVRE